MLLALLAAAGATAQMLPLPTEAEIPDLRARAERGDALALYQLAVCNDEAIGMPVDAKAALGLALKAAEKGHVPAMRLVSRLQAMEGDKSASLRWARQAAATGDPIGVVALASCHAYGIGVPESQTEAIRLLREAADSGNAYAMGYLALELSRLRDPECERWAKAAAERGDRTGNAILASLCFYGTVMPKDLEAAERHARRAAERNDDDGHLILALLATEATKPDYAKAIPHLRRAGELGNARARAILGTMYFEGTKGVDRDYAEAARLCRLAAQHGDGLGMFCYGAIIHEGRGRSADKTLGSGIIQAASKLGDGGAHAWVVHGGAAEFTSATFSNGTKIAESILRQLEAGQEPRELAEGYVRDAAGTVPSTGGR